MTCAQLLGLVVFFGGMLSVAAVAAIAHQLGRNPKSAAFWFTVAFCAIGSGVTGAVDMMSKEARLSLFEALSPDWCSADWRHEFIRDGHVVWEARGPVVCDAETMRECEYCRAAAVAARNAALHCAAAQMAVESGDLDGALSALRRACETETDWRGWAQEYGSLLRALEEEDSE